MKERPKPGIVVRRKFGDRYLEGVVMLYEMEYGSTFFPVKFADGFWRLMMPSMVEEVSRRP